jgi:chromosome segregation ATPase
MSDFDELIENVEYYTREVANNTEWGMNTNEVKRLLAEARRALTDAISAVTSERDALKAANELNRISASELWKSNKNMLEELAEVKKTRDNLLAREKVSIHAYAQLEMQLMTTKAKLAEANEDAKRFYDTRFWFKDTDGFHCEHCGCIQSEDFYIDSGVEEIHKIDCPTEAYRARLAKGNI